MYAGATVSERKPTDEGNARPAAPNCGDISPMMSDEFTQTRRPKESSDMSAEPASKGTKRLLGFVDALLKDPKNARLDIA